METSETYFKNKITAKRICNEFVKLYVSLTDLRNYTNDDINYVKCSEFLNYWVNFKLSKSMKNEDYTVRHVYNAIETHIMYSDVYDKYINFICDINKDELHKMNILYNLYEKYTDIDVILDNSTNKDKELLLLLSLSTACCQDYLEANYMCNGVNDDNSNHSQFCLQLEKFKTKYERLYDRVDGKGSKYISNFKRLTQCDNNVISTALIGTTVGLVPLLMGLYKVK
ncbi:hypothetical protein PVMG_05806 [Plasmodium vivax Mauritania I]|uniref:Uncharacterized protein n=1 Tax=Plasmodium vivax Mauritania I TaxID=1035515 RepID=A0A0J9TJT6_PLAVI|nr:hypothetical protein PVMG_05806 [Plasmodium vivax Mauritania I]